MFQRLKAELYFPIARYFGVFAKFKLNVWKPKVIVVTGSSGKTTLMSLLEAQIGDRAYYSHHANSSYGLPFNILGLSRNTLFQSEWLKLFILAPFLAFSKPPIQKIYIAEADADRPGEAKFISDLLSPDCVIWVSTSRTHSMNFDKLVESGNFKNVEDAIAAEYSAFGKNAKELVIANADYKLIEKKLRDYNSKTIQISKKALEEYFVTKNGTHFKINGESYEFDCLLPEAVYFSIQAVRELTDYLEIPFDGSFKNFALPPGRSSVFEGVKNITIIDSCYNSNLSSAGEIINMFNKIETKPKWAVIGDMLEQGKSEREEHEKLARILVESDYDRLILLGPRIAKFGLPFLKKHYKDRVVAFNSPKDVLNYIKKNIQGGETILFKGARFLEGVIEDILKNKEDASKLSRREKIWEKRRRKWGL